MRTLLQTASGALLLAMTGASFAQDPTSLANCPARQPVLRVAGVFTSEEFSPHPVETRFASTHYSRLYLAPLFGSDPWEEKVDGKYGVAESWTYLPGARGIVELGRHRIGVAGDVLGTRRHERVEHPHDLLAPQHGEHVVLLVGEHPLELLRSVHDERHECLFAAAEDRVVGSDLDHRFVG